MAELTDWSRKDNPLKIAVIGGGGVGKSALTIQFVKHEFVTIYDPIIEDNYELKITVDGSTIHLDCLDTAGQDDFSALRHQYMRSRQGYIMVTDISEPNSLQSLEQYIEQIKMVRDTDTFPAVLAVNKVDLSNRKLNTDTIKNFLDKHLPDCPVIETSAKTRQNVSECFEELLRQCKKT
jgi:GTPase KRas protein